MEVYNASDHSIELAGLQLVNARGTTRKNEVPLRLPPGGYAVFTDDAEDLAARFPEVDLGRVVELDLPALPNEEGSIRLETATGLVLDAFIYSSDMHNVLVDPQGASLERSSYERPANEAGNWHTAASASGYGTPTRPNSQAEAAVATGAQVVLATPTFTPNGDGQDDRLHLTYRTDRPGWLASLAIFDANGRPVRPAERTDLLGVTGALSWDGTDASGRLQQSGPYVLLVKLLHPQGHTVTFRLVAVLVS